MRSGLNRLAGAISLAMVIGAPAMTRAADYHVEYLFKGSDGQHPVGDVLPFGGKLYGVTTDGGSANSGAVFSFDPGTGTENALYSFKGGSDGATPDGGLVALGGLLYGTTLGGGSAQCGCGTLYSIDPATGAETVLHRFGSDEGRAPMGRLLAIGGVLYGANYDGGLSGAGCADGCGTVFSIEPGSGELKTLYAFHGAPDGAAPNGDLIFVDGLLLGLTTSGGSAACFQGQGCGAAFSLDPNTGAETVLHVFDPAKDGFEPVDGLLLVGKRLYGATRSGGAGDANSGTVYSFKADGSGARVVFTFGQRPKGLDPSSGLVKANGVLYGVTFAGGRHDTGVVYSLTPAGVETVPHTFQQTGDGNYPAGVLVRSGGKLFGTTGYGGNNACSQGCGTIFSIAP